MCEDTCTDMSRAGDRLLLQRRELLSREVGVLSRSIASLFLYTAYKDMAYIVMAYTVMACTGMADTAYFYKRRIQLWPIHSRPIQSWRMELWPCIVVAEPQSCVPIYIHGIYSYGIYSYGLYSYGL